MVTKKHGAKIYELIMCNPELSTNASVEILNDIPEDEVRPNLNRKEGTTPASSTERFGISMKSTKTICPCRGVV